MAPGGCRVPGFIRLHLHDDGAARQVRSRQATQVVIEMGNDLALGLGQEAHVEAVSAQTTGRADREGTEIPAGVQAARVGVERRQPRRAPVQVVEFLAQTSPVWFTRIRLPEAMRSLGLSAGSGIVAAGEGRGVRAGGAANVRSARSKPAIRRSRTGALTNGKRPPRLTF
jgi:hypothetical protein